MAGYGARARLLLAATALALLAPACLFPASSTGRTRCDAAADCPSHVCYDGLCEPPSCHDYFKDQDETDVDCGGATSGCQRCALGQRCLVDGDCDKYTGACVGGRCSVPGH